MKQVIVVNEALAMPAGKMAAQVAHASVAAFLKASDENRSNWLQHGMPKIVLAGSSESELKILETQAGEARIAFALIRDAGKTVLPSGTVTCLGLGPANADVINALTKDLRLL